MYAIKKGDSWVKASPRAAADRASQTIDRVVSPGALRGLTDSELVGMGVRRVINAKPPAAPKHKRADEGPLVVNGYFCEQTWVFNDEPVESAKSQLAGQASTKAEQVMNQGVVVNGHRFSSDVNATLGYLVVNQGTYDPDVSWNTLDGERTQLSKPQFNQLTKGVADLRIAAMRRHTEILDAIDAAPNLDALKLIDVDAGWPA